MAECQHAACIVPDATYVAGSTWLTESDVYMLSVTEDTERDFYFSCGCWSGAADHSCGNGMGSFRERYGCRCGAPDDCYCHEDCTVSDPDRSCAAHREDYARDMAEDHAEAILLDIQRNLWQ